MGDENCWRIAAGGLLDIDLKCSVSRGCVAISSWPAGRIRIFRSGFTTPHSVWNVSQQGCIRGHHGFHYGTQHGLTSGRAGVSLLGHPPSRTGKTNSS